jgi:putative photosynthetic complex assembly protein
MNALTPPPNAIPRGLLIAMAAMVLVTVVGVGAVRLSGTSIHSPDARVAALRSLRFTDGADGSVEIRDGKTGAVIERVQGEAGFLRGALRALARERRKRDLGPEAAFDLIGRADGRLTLSDPATGERIDLESFGPTNAATFARLLTADNAVNSAANSLSQSAVTNDLPRSKP